MTLRGKIDPKNRSNKRLLTLTNGNIALMNNNIQEASKGKNLQYTTENVLTAMEKIKTEAQMIGNAIVMEINEEARVIDENMLPKVMKIIHELEDSMQQQQGVSHDFEKIRLN